jgi:hypothetical protein
LEWVSVVVVEVAGTAGTAGAVVVVEVVVVGAGAVVQAVIETRAETARIENSNFFINIMVVSSVI